MIRICAVLVVLFATAAAAQPRPIFDPDDFLDPRPHDNVPVFASRLVIGAAWSFVDDYRPANQDAGFVHVTNSFYIRRLQFDYKHSEILGDDPPPVHVCACDPPIFFPTPPPRDATPAAPPPGSKDALQVAFYAPALWGIDGIPVMMRYRLTWSRQTIDTDISLPLTNEIVSRRSGREQTFGLDADTYFRFRGRAVYGSVQYSRNSRRGTTDDRMQHELVYTNRFPGTAWKRVLFRPTLTLGGVSNRGGTAINLVSPSFEAFLHERVTRANFHLVWNPQITNSGTSGWNTTHQVAIFVDRKLFLKLFRPRS